jgi:hypothetical protein
MVAAVVDACATQIVALLTFRYRQNTVSAFVVVVRFVYMNGEGLEVLYVSGTTVR